MENKEIGSEFWDIPVVNQGNGLFPDLTQWFLSGRSALQAIIKEIKDCHTVAMPSWCCDSMIKPFVQAGFEVNFYPVIYKNGIIQKVSLDSDVLLLMDYFGYAAQDQKYGKYKGKVIRDVTHSIFSSSFLDADYYFGSLRKWCGLWTGGYAWTQDGHKLTMEVSGDQGYIAFRKKAMEQKRCYINGCVDNKGRRVVDKEYLDIFASAEDCLEKVGISPATLRDEHAAKFLDIDNIRALRKTNAAILRSAFPEWLVFSEMRDSDCPMFVPILVPDNRRDQLRKYLIKHKIYCPIHWPESDYHRLDEKTRFIYRNELSLICDQRYGKEDMYRIVKTIMDFWKEV